MLETPASLNQHAKIDLRQNYPADNLARYSFHTGAQLRPLKNDEICPLLFRDLGPAAMVMFLTGELRRLAGPYSPIIYMRTENYQEPYIDYESTGRIIFLRPLMLQPWYSGINSIYVAQAARRAPAETIAFVPGHCALAEIAREAAHMKDGRELREALGGNIYDQAADETVHRLREFAIELAAAEKLAEPLRRRLQSSKNDDRKYARAELARLNLSEHDLCAAWHHLPRARREFINEMLPRVENCEVV
jgi:hypothetical protein